MEAGEGRDMLPTMDGALERDSVQQQRMSSPGNSRHSMTGKQQVSLTMAPVECRGTADADTPTAADGVLGQRITKRRFMMVKRGAQSDFSLEPVPPAMADADTPEGAEDVPTLHTAGDCMWQLQICTQLGALYLELINHHAPPDLVVRNAEQCPMHNPCHLGRLHNAVHCPLLRMQCFVSRQ